MDLLNRLFKGAYDLITFVAITICGNDWPSKRRGTDTNADLADKEVLPFKPLSRSFPSPRLTTLMLRNITLQTTESFEHVS